MTLMINKPVIYQLVSFLLKIKAEAMFYCQEEWRRIKQRAFLVRVIRGGRRVSEIVLKI